MGEYILKQRTFLNNIDDYYASCVTDVDTIKPYLNPVESILDVGCGLAGPTAVLANFLLPKRVWLFDKEDNNNLRYGFDKDDSYYNKQELTCEFFQDNTEVEFEYVSNLEHVWYQPDLIVSFYSWGWHYSVTTYFDQIVPLCKTGTRVIVDLRSNIGEVIYFAHAFEIVDKINVDTQTYKGNRYIFQKT